MAEPEFVQRINNPAKYPYIRNNDGSISTHRMAAETDEDGNWFVFPTIQMVNGKLVQYEDNFEAMKKALKSGNFLSMPSKTDALKYAEGGYKKGTELEKFRPSLANEAGYE